MKLVYILIVCACALSLSSRAQEQVVIEAFESSGQIQFSKVSNAVSYRVEWAPGAGGPWTNFPTAAANLHEIISPGLGIETASVPMVYRVVAIVTNPPVPDFVVANSGSSAYLINGESNPTLTLTRGETYVIGLNAPVHPFWIKTSPVIGIDNLYTNGVVNNGAYEGQIIFTVPMSAPNTLYYICQFHGGMQGVINIIGPPAPAGMSLITAGEFVMGDAFSEYDINELPLHTVYVSAFYMDQYEVTKALWDEVRAHNGGNGYSYSNTGQVKATNHPVHTVNWFDAVKWCNARSEMEGLTPVYYTDAGFTTAYKTGEIAPFANWSANGYRLPTEAEWEKAARGGVAGQRFPWGNTISHSNANYWSYWESGSPIYSYDVSPSEGLHPTFSTGSFPSTSPVGYFAPNGYGLYDMAGNLWEWCWDWYSSSYYSSSPSTAPRGPSSGSFRVLRGGSWNGSANDSRVAYRFYINPDGESDFFGFRCARGL